LAQAADISRSLRSSGPDPLELRNEAIACLVLADVRETQRHWATDGSFSCDEGLRTYAVSDHAGDVVIRRVSDDAALDRLAGDGTPAGFSQFDPHGRYLVVRYGDGRCWKVWDLRHRVAPLKLTVADWSPVFSPDGHLIGTIALDGSIQLHDL